MVAYHGVGGPAGTGLAVLMDYGTGPLWKCSRLRTNRYKLSSWRLDRHTLAGRRTHLLLGKQQAVGID